MEDEDDRNLISAEKRVREQMRSSIVRPPPNVNGVLKDASPMGIIEPVLKARNTSRSNYGLATNLIFSEANGPVDNFLREKGNVN